jgi:hypothetical protein
MEKSCTPLRRILTGADRPRGSTSHNGSIYEDKRFGKMKNVQPERPQEYDFRGQKRDEPG